MLSQDLDAGAINAQLARLLSNSAFSRSPRQADLLRYLVGETLEGRGSRIKATSIAVDVFGRDETFDQQRDTIVRVEAGRLRRRLGEYYESQGQEDPVEISIPKGTYQPQIRQRAVAVDPTAAVGTAAKDRSASRDKLVLYGIALLVGITLLATLYQIFQPQPAGSDIGKEPTSTPGGPFVMVLPFSTLSEGDHSRRLAFGVVESLIANLTKLQGLSVMAHASILEQQQEGGPASIQSLRREYGVTHVLRGSLEEEEQVLVVNVQLIETETGTVIWADRQNHTVGKLLEMEDELALQIASQLSVQIQPDERAIIGLSKVRNPEALVFYRQGLVTLIPPKDMTRIRAARQLFQRAQEIEPGFGGGYAGESFSHAIKVLFLNTVNPQEDLAIALSLAERAIEVDPNFGMGYAVRSFASAMAGDFENAVRDSEKAVLLQPGDAFTRFIQGMNLIIAGQAEDALPVLRHALRLDPMESRTPYLNVLAIAQYAAGHYAQALQTLEYNLQRSGPAGPHMDLLMAAAHAQLGQQVQSREIVRDLKVRAPDFPVEKWLGMWLRDNGQLQRTLQLLYPDDTLSD